MINFPILTAQILVPIFGIFLILCLPYLLKKPTSDNVIKFSALVITAINLLLSIVMFLYFDAENSEMQLTEKRFWFKDYGIFYSLGVDGISIYFVMLTTFLIPVCIIASWRSIVSRVKEYVLLFLLLESLLIGVFLSTDLILFYLFFESVLIPMFLIIGIWGGENRVYAAFKFFIYTLFGSVFMLLAVLYILFNTATSEVSELIYILPLYSLDIQKWLWLAFFVSFAIKIPMWPFHTWLPDAHVQAPTAGSVILAGILLKMGGYGFLRFSLPMLPDASRYFADFVLILSVIALIYTSLVALLQDNIKKLIAYSSVAHMGYVTAGIFTFNSQGIQGAIFQMISHGLLSAALFLCFGVLYDRMHAKEINFYTGLTHKMPKFAMFFMIFTLSSIGLPATSGFVGEFWVIFASFKKSYTFGILMSSGMVLGAAYMLWLYARIMFGKINNQVRDILDIDSRDYILFASIAIIVVFLGVYPNAIIKGIKHSVDRLGINIMQQTYATSHNKDFMVLSKKELLLNDNLAD